MLKKKNKKIYILSLAFLVLLFFSFLCTSNTLAAELNSQSKKITLSNSSYPLSVKITADKINVKNDGVDSSQITVFVSDSKGLGVSDIEIKLNQRGLVSIYPVSGFTDKNGRVSFRVSSNQEKAVTFGISLKNPINNEIYSSNKIVINFTSPSNSEIFLGTISDFRDNMTTQNIVNYVATPAVTVAAGVGVYSVVVNVLNSSLPYLNYLINLLLQFLGVRRKPKPWGIVYDTMTKEPVPLALIRLIDKKTKNIIATVATDKNGRFSLPLKSGEYFIQVAKSGYTFPSVFLKGSTVDGYYHNLYFGEPFKLKSGEKINFVIPIDLNTAIESHLTFWDNLKNISNKLSIPFFVTSFLLSLFILWVNFTLFNEILVLLYIFIIILKILRNIKQPKDLSWGVVFDSKTKLPITGIPIKVFGAKYNKLLETKVSDDKGRFGLVLPKGRYYLKIASYEYSLDTESVLLNEYDNYQGEIFSVEDNEVLNFNIALNKQGSKKNRK
uniref:Big-1 domain-containing protein n=1 Tax=candidate division CPR3 bacterium TaxID=2268181 RepID=A0A7C4M124_UNCC3